MNKAQIAGIVGTAEEKAKEWGRLYAKAVKEDNPDAIAALIAVAGKFKRVHGKASELLGKDRKGQSNMDKLLKAEDKIKEPKIATGDLEKDLDFAASLSSSQRKANSFRKFAEQVENL